MRPLAWILLPALLAASSAPQEGSNPIDDHFREFTAKPASDGVFLRRVTLDLAGRLPLAEEIAAFKGDRKAAINALIQGHDAATYQADLWLQWLIDYDFETQDLYAVDFGAFHRWLKGQWSSDVGYDRFVTSLLADRGSRTESPAVNYSIKHLRGGEPPVKLAIMSARLFLGKDIRCAQCHDDTFGRWTQDEFWGYVGFFRPLYIRGYYLGERENNKYRSTIADHLNEVRAETRFLGGDKPEKGKKLGDELARFTLEAEKGDAFAGAYVDRVWRLLFDRTTPKKLRPELIADFKAHRYSIHHLWRRILNSKVYQLDSRGSEDDREEYKVGPIKAMNLQQFMRAFSDAFDLRSAHEEMYQRGAKDPKNMEVFKDREVMRLFFHKWAKEMVLPKGADPEVTSPTGTVRMALKIMNNRKIQSMVYSGWGVLKQAMKKQSRPKGRVTFLFATLLGRNPTQKELDRFIGYIEEKRKSNRAYEDIFWVLVNSAEFWFVH